MTYSILHGDCLELLKGVQDSFFDSIITDPPYEIGFMSKKWDRSGIAFNTDLWMECLRVLKPGGHLLSFGGARTYHRSACAIEDAGFEIRDCLFYAYGTGFPKSVNIGREVDRVTGRERTVIDKRDVGHDITGRGFKAGKPERKIKEITMGYSEYEGWGTALKPAVEPIVMARKPISERNVAENILRWRTGGLNIEACRIPLSGEAYCGENKRTPSSGRFPANLLHDGSNAVTDLFPVTRSVSAARFFYCVKPGRDERNAGCGMIEGGNDHPTVKPVALLRYLCRLITPVNGHILDPFAGSGSTGCAAVEEGFHFTGMELQEHYCSIALARITHYSDTEG